MLSDKVQDRLEAELSKKIENLNTTILKEIGKSIKKIRELDGTNAYQLVQQMKYGGSYTKIIKKLAQITNMSERDIQKIIEKAVKNEVDYAKQFLEYRGVDYIPYEENMLLQDQVNAMAKITQNRFNNLMNTTAMVVNNKLVPLTQVYNRALDEAIISIAQGKETYDMQMSKLMKQMASYGIRTRKKTGEKVVDYKSGYSKRLDSALWQSINEGVSKISNEISAEFAKQYGADGVEISVHENPAPDHEDIQGKQYSNEEFEELNNELDRPISTLNCRHIIFQIVLGVNKPLYTNKQLEAIKKRNHKGFNFEGKHYTMYEGTQLQRQIETKVRRLRDIQTGALARGDEDEAGIYQRKINALIDKYNKLSKTSGLTKRKDRME